ncbi:hypothetical protein FH972_026625 [Carpinus fangiana]|uniref:RRM domain-containing protein n=1 Tax=Carpinus fangiana TaxID=176857 RepID=A0A5N6L4J2_9ROSI|nr:hypothetical protein FH972_026625 [Carpinus fangiana]
MEKRDAGSNNGEDLGVSPGGCGIPPQTFQKLTALFWLLPQIHSASLILNMATTELSKKRKAAAPAAASSTKKPKKVVEKKSEIVPDVKIAPPRTKTVTKKTAAPKPTKPSAPSKSSKKPSKPTPEEISADLARFDSASESEDAEDGVEDDQTAALLAGFSSDSEDEAEDNALAAADGLQLPVPGLPTSAGLDDRIAAANTGANEPGVVYISRIPHGFYEHQMSAYFSQFGDITRLRLSRNRRTGASKHYAFLEFAHMEVARIVAETMNNYLMFGHSLKVRVVEPARVHPELFKGAGARFRKVPWNRIERTRVAKTDRKGWEKRVGKEEQRRSDKKRLLGELGYEFKAPAIRSVSSVPVKEKVEVAADEQPEEEADMQKAIDSKPADEALTVDDIIGSAAKVAKKEKVPVVKKSKAAKAKKAKA